MGITFPTRTTELGYPGTSSSGLRPLPWPAPAPAPAPRGRRQLRLPVLPHPFCSPAHGCSVLSGSRDRGGQGRGSPLALGSPRLHQSVSALLAIRGSSAPPSPAGLCVPESKMAGSRRKGPRAGARPFICALLLSFSRFVGSDGMGGDAAAPGAAGTPAESPHRRFEYKYSFKGPHLVQSDGTVPFWAHAGSKPGLGRGPGSFLAFRLFGPSPQCPAGPRVSSSPARHMR